VFFSARALMACVFAVAECLVWLSSALPAC
jgi:hypothetical protein